MIKKCIENMLLWKTHSNDRLAVEPPRVKEEPMSKPKIIQMPLENFKVGWPKQAEIAIIHYSAGYSVKDCYNILLKSRLSVHESIERDGVIYQHLDHNNRGIHAGYGQWGGKGNMNSRSFGVEVINFGWGFLGDGSPSKNRSFGPPQNELIQDKHQIWHRIESYRKNGEKISTRVLTKQKMKKYPDHRPSESKKLWAEYPKEQVDSTHWLVWEWMKHSPDIILENVIGHEHVSPHRKTDPGPAWPWRETEAFLEKMAAKERPELLDPEYKQKKRIKAVQSHIHRCGPDIGSIDGIWGPRTMNGILKVIEDYNDVYSLGLSTSDIRKEKCLVLANALRLIPGFDPKNR